ncbi:hypothetical protein ABZ807_22090 [Micromonospora sp. NPDC047548]|uniref:hypothetical protein n=1 Tax=Micromonospora sp. NPDC047548 TaxID=3155624 RepID=UPI003411319B
MASSLIVLTSSFVSPAPAVAAPLGTVGLSATSGTVDATPVFAVATASRPCPSGFGRNAQLRVGPPGGPYSNLARPLIAGGYDQQPVTARPNRSFATALGGAPRDGEWWIVVECVSETQGVHPERFVTEITVSGKRWRTGRPAGVSAPTPTGDGSLVVPTPSGAAVSGSPAPATATPSPVATVPGQRLVGNGARGTASVANLWWILAFAGVLFLVGTVWLLTRRHEPSGGRGAAGRR